MPVKVPAAVLEGLEAVRQSGKTNMLDRPRVAKLALRLGHLEVALWLEDSGHRSAYAEGIFRGFEAEASSA